MEAGREMEGEVVSLRRWRAAGEMRDWRRVWVGGGCGLELGTWDRE